MLKSLEITNFQSHKHSVLEFSPGVNVIIGQSDSGKTAIIRALKWVLTNKPAGESMRSYWGGDTTVNLSLDNARIERIRTKKENAYLLNGSKFEAMRGAVPEEIQQALNINAINVSEQLDAPFLLSNSPGEVAQHFNKVAQLDVIDRGSSAIKKWVTQGKQDIKSKKAQIEKAKEELIQYDYLEQMEKDVESLEKIEQEKNATTQQIIKVQELIEQVDSLNTEMERAEKILIIENSVTVALEKIKQLNTLQAEINTLIAIITEIETIDKQAKESQALLTIEKSVQGLISMQAEKANVISEISSLKSLMINITNIDKKIKGIGIEMIKLQKQMPDVCPFCGQRMPKEMHK